MRKNEGARDGKQNENPSTGAHPVSIPRAWEQPEVKEREEKGKKRVSKEVGNQEKGKSKQARKKEVLGP